jgi:hypothetical protein
MGIFNFLESFFLLSLAIMFVLVSLLLYHIRGRMNTGEQRVDNLFKVVTNLTNEVNAIKVYQANMKYSNYGCDMIPFQPTVKKIVVSDDEHDDADDADDEEDSEEDSEEELDSEDDEDEEEDDEDEDEENNRVVVVVDEDIEILEIPDEIRVLKIGEEDEDIVGAEIDEDIEDIEDHTTAAAPTEPEPEHLATDDDAEDYNKMNISALRKLVSSKGLATDVTKMKKNELIHLLL